MANLFCFLEHSGNFFSFFEYFWSVVVESVVVEPAETEGGLYTVLNRLLFVFFILKALPGLFRYPSQHFATAGIPVIQRTDEEAQ